MLSWYISEHVRSFSQNKRNLITFLVVIFAVALSFSTADAQLNRRQVKKNNKRMQNFRGKKNIFGKGRIYNDAGISLNALNYFGDLAPLSSRFSTDWSLTSPSVGVSFGHRFGPFYTLRTSFLYGTLKGNDFESADPYGEQARFRYVRNLSFRNRIKELAITGVFDLYKNENTYISRVQWTPYAYAGVAVFHHNPQARVSEASTLPEAGQWVDLQPLGTEGQYLDLPDTIPNYGLKPYKRVQISIPFGIGIRYKVNDLVDLSIETGTRWLFTDYIDDVSSNYINVDRWPDGSLVRELSDRSQEEFDAISNAPRDMEAVAATAGGLVELPRGSGSGVYTYGGYGREFIYNTRGHSNNNDMVIVTTIRVTYILASRYKKAKFR